MNKEYKSKYRMSVNGGAIIEDDGQMMRVLYIY